MNHINYIETNVPELGKTRIKFYGIDNELYKIYTELDEFNRQKKMKHLGIISLFSDGANHTRFDYLSTQCAMVDLLNNLHKGTQNIQLGSIKINKEEFEGSSLLKAWFMFSNIGHCFNTFADEKTLLHFANQNKGFRKFIVDQIKDTELKKWAVSIIRNNDYQRFHYVISLYRIYKHRLNQRNTKGIIEPLKALILLDYSGVNNTMKLQQLRNLFDTIRDISIISLDSNFTHIPFSINVISSLISLSNWEEYYNDKHFVQHLKPFFKMLRDELYINKRILANYKFYEYKALEFCNSHDIETILDSAFSKGLYDLSNSIDKFKHFARISILDKNINYSDLSRKMHEIFDDINNVYFLIDYVNDEQMYFVDIVFDNNLGQGDFATAYWKICQLINDQLDALLNIGTEKYKHLFDAAAQINLSESQLEEYNNQIIDIITGYINEEINEKLIPIYRELLWCTIAFLIHDKYSFDILTTSNKYSSFGLDSQISDSLSDNLKKALVCENHPDRINELNQILYSLKYKREGFRLGCISRIEIYDITEAPSKAKCTDIDGLIIYSTTKKLIIEFHESKNCKNSFGEAKKDINKKMKKLFRKGFPLRTIKVSNYGGKLQLSIKANA